MNKSHKCLIIKKNKNPRSFDLGLIYEMVRTMRVERTRVAPLPPEDSVSAISPRPHFANEFIVLCYTNINIKFLQMFFEMH